MQKKTLFLKIIVIHEIIFKFDTMVGYRNSGLKPETLFLNNVMVISLRQNKYI